MTQEKDETTYDLNLLEQSITQWNSNKSLRYFYKNAYTNLLKYRAPGDSLEIGSGCGFIKEIDPNILTSDVSKTKYVDRTINAYDINEGSNEWANIIVFDVIHHLTKPIDFFRSASDVLAPGGRLLICEPASTHFGNLFYNLFHHERCAPKLIKQPFTFSPASDGLYSNMGFAHVFFNSRNEKSNSILSSLNFKIIRNEYRDIIGYPTTGGFSRDSILPNCLVKRIIQFESKLPQWILKRLGLRMVIVLEKQ